MIDESNVTTVGYFGTILKTTNGGENWNLQASGTGRHLYSVSFVDTNYGIAVGGTTESGIILKTTDGGETWVTKLEGIPETLYGVSLVDENYGTAVGGHFYQTSDYTQNNKRRRKLECTSS